MGAKEAGQGQLMEFIAVSHRSNPDKFNLVRAGGGPAEDQQDIFWTWRPLEIFARCDGVALCRVVQRRNEDLRRVLHGRVRVKLELKDPGLDVEGELVGGPGRGHRVRPRKVDDQVLHQVAVLQKKISDESTFRRVAGLNPM